MERIVIECRAVEGHYVATIRGEGGEYLGGSPDEAIGCLVREGLWLGGRLPCVITDVVRDGEVP